MCKPICPVGNSICWPFYSPHPDAYGPRDELIDLLWPDRYLSDSRTLDTHIHRLRAKLEPEPTEPRFIVTVRGVGFRIDPDGAHPMPSVLSPGGHRTHAVPA